MDQNTYNRLRKQVDFVKSLLAVLVIALFVLALLGPHDALVTALAVVIGGGLLNLYRQHRILLRYICPNCGESPHHKVDDRAGEHHDPGTASCLHCGQRLME
ncbi:hypothetical protein SAMN05216588_101110 [Pseudomonas flavescens]|uniref:Uncharacterized protein n=1 Tax=Phytopseudomonas flavescens TaxID=29435 RepID=A0A1G7XG97_9GAMM|nr:hypothetical protein [Pseudomonas flavescens]SDG83147.1 hypothetical protein SAMN05216588_101110 [Pseudomonas flavescens]